MIVIEIEDTKGNTLGAFELTEIKIKRISKFDAFKADEYIRALENEMKEVKHNLRHLTDYAIKYFEDLLKFFDSYNMEKQLVFKSVPKKEFLDIFTDHSVKYMYMPIVSKKEEVDAAVSQKNLNLVGFEVLAESEKDIFFDKKYLSGLKKKGYFCWINAIRLNDVRKLYAGYDDNVSIIEGGDKGWGVLIERGADIIQTDWPFLLEKYLNKNN